MIITSKSSIILKCNRCGITHIDDNKTMHNKNIQNIGSGFNPWAGNKDTNTHYCPNCYLIEREDNLTIVLPKPNLPDYYDLLYKYITVFISLGKFKIIIVDNATVFDVPILEKLKNNEEKKIKKILGKNLISIKYQEYSIQYPTTNKTLSIKFKI